MERWVLLLLLHVCMFSGSVMSDSLDPVGFSLPGSFVHVIFQARILGRLPFPPLGDLPNPGIKLLFLLYSLSLCPLGSPYYF